MQLMIESHFKTSPQKSMNRVFSLLQTGPYMPLSIQVGHLFFLTTKHPFCRAFQGESTQSFEGQTLSC
jgi:hypothetical protein